jgi:hypothetical protein
MLLDAEAFAATTQFFSAEQLLSEDECRQIVGLLDANCAFADAVRAACSVHVHVKVADVAALPHQRIQARGVAPENVAPGYVKYSFPGGINVIFSSIPIAVDDLIDGAVTTPKPFMDHAGLDIRHENTVNRAVFDAIAGLAASLGWRIVAQRGPVHCCHTEVAEKRWLYPPAWLGSWRRPLEIAFGSLRILDAAAGCDPRPMDPAHPLTASSTGCCAGGGVPAQTSPSLHPQRLRR